MDNKGLKAVLSAAAAGLAAYLGIVAIPLAVLVVMMIADYISGITAAYITKDLSSRKGLEGIVRKVGYMLLIGVAMTVDYLISHGLTAVNIKPGIQMWFALLVIAWLIINEMISILENLSRMDVPVPGFLTRIIKRLRDSAEKKEDR